MPSPHDRLVKSVLGEPRYAAQLFERFLPPELVAGLDLGALTRVDRSFVDEALSERHADLLFSVPLRSAPGEPPRLALAYLLFEHQSTPDPWMPFRLLVYMLRVWERWRRDHPGARGLPLIIPLVLYHGEAPWSAPLDLAELIELPEGLRPALAEALPHLRHALLDLSAIPEEVLTRGALVALVLLLLKQQAKGDLVEHMDRWRETLRRAVEEGGLRAVEIVTHYTLIVNTRPDTLPRLAQLTGEVLGETAQEKVMTAGELLIEQGRIEGLQRGRREGRQEGREEGREEGLAEGRRAQAADSLLRMLKLKFGEVPDDVRIRVGSATLQSLEAWTERIFSGTSPEDVVS
ncbi:MAG: Rpn family recombination-promoting nuclease/putative transposase [Alphaproteobacteria bacterium]|nr:Rpn family recombination-promoting nuclease/putative transposase [Alphaproteobacteria bacterium]MCB9792760.1 Rpn family recombination-promoting nuclease/putative transposase [Alphaproteobacteria bacterium]